MELMLLTLITVLLIVVLVTVEHNTKNNAKHNKTVLAILQSLQGNINLDIPKEVNANLTDIGDRLNNGEALENIRRTNSLWEEDSLEGEEIEKVYGR
jgi:hypothetical protein